MIAAANVEAESAPNCVGMVKLMGRDSGFIAMNASMASRDVNMVLIPEVPWQMEGKDGLYEQIIHRLKVKGHAVIVLAEGADDSCVDIHLEKSSIKDDGGHVKHADIGHYLSKQLVEYALKHHDFKINMKYIDPTYAIRGISPNAGDTILCAELG